MAISFAPLKNKISAISRLKHAGIVGGWTYDTIRAGIDKPIQLSVTDDKRGGVSIRAVDAICAYLDCQPGDIMEYVPDEPENQ